MSTYTTSQTFTITNARYITSKIAADLASLRSFYGDPADKDIHAYAEEAALLLRDGYLERVDFGYKRIDPTSGDEWVLLLRYTVRNGSLPDDYSGRIPAGVDVRGTRFCSFLSYSGAFYMLSEAERERVKKALPVNRNPMAEASLRNGTWGSDRSYSSAGVSVGRSVFTAR